MKYDIDFLPVGEGDSSGDAIAIRYAEDDSDNFTIIVIDGGTKESGGQLVQHIKDHYHTDKVDHVVNTHPDQDHASGLSVVMEELAVGCLWIHRPWEHVSKVIHHFRDERITENSLKERFKDKLSASYALEEIAREKGVPIHEPYQGERIGAFKVMSPGIDWYLHTLLPDFNKTPEKKESYSSFSQKIQEMTRSILESLDKETLRDGGETSAENDSSVVLHAEFDGKGIMFTGDAGIKALNEAADYHGDFDNLKFIQIPHHGSRRNVSPSVLDRLLGNKGQERDNKTAFVSAGKDSTKHPRKVVINAFIRRGCKVVATKGMSILQYRATPDRGWVPVEPMSFSPEVESYE